MEYKSLGVFFDIGSFSTEIEPKVQKDLVEYHISTVKEIVVVSRYIFSTIDIRRTIDENLFKTIVYAVGAIYTIGKQHGRVEGVNNAVLNKKKRR